MKRKLIARAGTCALAAAAALALAASPAAAHERREIGNYTFVVGFRVEPALQYEVNGIDLRIARKDAAGTPVENLQDALEVTVSAGGKSMPTKLRAVFRDPGHYTSDFIPTAAGDYVFQIGGTIDGQAIDEKFASGPGRFNPVEAAEALQFPARNAMPDQMAVMLAQAESKANQAQTIAIAGAAAGLIGMALGGLAFARRRP